MTRLGVVRNLERWAIVPLGAAGGLLGIIAITAVLGEGFNAPFSTAQKVGVGVVTGVLTSAALWLAFRARTPEGVSWATFGSCMLFAAINCPLCFLTTTVLQDGGVSINLLGAFLFAGVVGLVFSLPLGLLWGLLLAVPMFVVARLRTEPTLDGPDRALRAVAGCISVGMFLGGLVAFILDLPASLLFGLSTLGVVAVVVTTVRLHRFDRFLRRARLGRAPGWSVAPLGELEEIPDDLPNTDIDHHPDAVLLREVSPTGEGAYRDGGVVRIPWALTRLAG